MLGYPAVALADTEHALKDAREIGQAATLMYALVHAPMTHLLCGDYTAANAQLDEVVALADEKGALLWKAAGMMHHGCVLALTNKASKAIHMFTAGITAWRSTGSTLWLPLWFPYLSKAYAELGRFDDAWRCIGEAMTAVETTKERWWEAAVHRTAGEIALMSPQPDAAKAQTYFERALTVSRQQEAKSWELRAAMSLARLWRDQGKVQQACDLLAPVYGWFTQGFDTRDLKEAKALLEGLE
jgi:predicted ATPase